MNFRTLKKDDMTYVLYWRSTCPQSLRTPFNLTEEQQLSFYDNVISNRNADAKFWAIEVDNKFVGMIGLENIQWTNRLAEISIILDPECHGNGYGQQAIQMLLDKGFNQLNLENIFGEAYLCNPAVSFWEKIIKQYNGTKAILPNRKYFNGRYYNAIYFNITKEEFNNCQKLS
jgi:predicted acetyltransferase